MTEMIEDGEERDDVDYTLPEEGKTACAGINTGTVLAWITGASRVPALGFSPRPSVEFDHTSSSNLPRATTCSNQLILPVNNLTMKPFLFARAMLEALAGGFFFGNL